MTNDRSVWICQKEVLSEINFISESCNAKILTPANNNINALNGWSPVGAVSKLLIFCSKISSVNAF